MVELDSTGTLTRGDVANFLRDFADELDDGSHEPGDVADEESPIEPITDDGGDRQSESAEAIADERSDEDTEGSTAEHAEELMVEHSEERSRDLERVTLIVGGDSATVSVPGVVDFDVEVESRSPMVSSGVAQRVDFELSWELENPDELDEEWLEVE